jgi:hypothetical protein
MPSLNCAGLAVSVELFARELANGFEHAIPGDGLVQHLHEHQALADQRHNAVERIDLGRIASGHGFYSFEVEAADQHAKLPKQALLRRRESCCR